MKVSNQFLILCLFAGSIFLFSNSGGRATTSNEGNTGAPGDAANTCVNCHNTSAALATLTTVSLLDANSTAVTSYMPQQKYTIRVEMTTAGNAAGYGFQLIPLKDADNTDVKGMTDAGNSNNYKIKSITNGRTYAEHDDLSPSKIFDVAWTAPAAGTGSVTFYAAGNSVNGNGTSGGDGADTDKLTVSEAVSSTNDLLSDAVGTLGLYPNPVRQQLNVRFVAAHTQAYQIKVLRADGKQIYVTTTDFQQGENRLNLPASTWEQGVYFLVVQDSSGSRVVRFVKI